MNQELEKEEEERLEKERLEEEEAEEEWVTWPNASASGPGDELASSGIPEAKEMLEEMGYDEEDVQDTADYESLIVEHIDNSSLFNVCMIINYCRSPCELWTLLALQGPGRPISPL